MFRSKSFNINRPVESGYLTRSKSSSDMYTASLDMKIFITIQEVNSEEAFRAMSKMIDETMAEDWYDFNLAQLDEEQKRWRNRHSQASDILGYIAKNARLQSMSSMHTGANKLFFIAYFRGFPVGALQLAVYDKDENNLPEVSFLATHTGIRGCGVLLIEYAVNKSQQLGNEGKLKLSPYEGAKTAYIKMGFVDKNNRFELHPDERTDKWIWNGNSQSYKYKLC